MGTLDFAILNHQCVTLATVLAKDGGTLEREVKVFSELAGRIAEKADLYLKISSVGNGLQGEGWGAILQSWRLGQGSHPKPSCYTGISVYNFTGDDKFGRTTYTNGSLTETTKTLPAFLIAS